MRFPLGCWRAEILTDFGINATRYTSPVEITGQATMALPRTTGSAGRNAASSDSRPRRHIRAGVHSPYSCDGNPRHPTAPRGHRDRTGTLNGYVRSIRRECLEEGIVFGEAHLHSILKTYASSHNQAPDPCVIGQGCSELPMRTAGR